MNRFKSMGLLSHRIILMVITACGEIRERCENRHLHSLSLLLYNGLPFARILLHREQRVNNISTQSRRR